MSVDLSKEPEAPAVAAVVQPLSGAAGRTPFPPPDKASHMAALSATEHLVAMSPADPKKTAQTDDCTAWRAGVFGVELEFRLVEELEAFAAALGVSTSALGVARMTHVETVGVFNEVPFRAYAFVVEAVSS